MGSASTRRAPTPSAPRRAPSQAYMQILDSESEDAEEAPVAEVPEAEAVATSADSDTAATAAGEDGAG